MIWKLTDNKDWKSLEQHFNWVRDMSGVEQHHLHHAEGNVAVHTQLVLKALKEIEEYEDLSEQDREILWAAALLHDVEKRSTSVDEGNGVISARGHARRGEFTARRVLFEGGYTPFVIRERVASLVRLHGLPLWLLDRPNPQHEALAAALRVDMLMLRVLSEADANGRICEDAGLLETNLMLFEEFCREQNCWRHPYPFPSENARFHFFHTPNSYVDYVPFDDFKCEVTLLSGLPGMGKDYFIKGLDLPVVSLDGIRRANGISPTDKSGNGRVVQQAKEEAREFLRRGQDFVWNGTNITRMMRSQLVDLFVSYGARVRIVYIECPYKQWLKQNREREFMLPEEVLHGMLDKLEIPLLTEAHCVEFVVED